MIVPRLGYDVRKASSEEPPDREFDGVAAAARAVVGGDEVVADRERECENRPSVYS
jgi:hypothetical protein